MSAFSQASPCHELKRKVACKTTRNPKPNPPERLMRVLSAVCSFGFVEFGLLGLRL